MSVSQAVLAFFSPEARPSNDGRKGQSATDGDFAKVLANHNTEQLDAYLDGLEQGGLPLPGEAGLAANGKGLPSAMQEWLGQLSFIGQEKTDAETGPEALAAIAEGWVQWLEEARVSLGGSQVAAAGDAEVEGALPTLVSETGLSVQRAGDLSISDAAVTMRQAARNDSAGASGTPDGQKDKLTLVSDAGEDQGKGRQATADMQLQNTPLQRSASVAMAADMQAAFAGKLAEQLDPKAGRATSEVDALEDAARPGTAAQNAAQAALIARPVNASAQTLGVPFGHQSWGEAMVQKVMWASSQNLRSVEILLDPAELGPLEIHIQNRGQEHTVQFVSQNPSVREALESQMYRLREMFSQQGMEQVNVTVADRSDGQSGREPQGGLAGEGQRSGGQGRSSGDDGQGESLLTTAAAAKVSSDRLVDFFA